MATPKARLTKSHYEQLAALRYALRGFQRFSEAQARSEGLTPQQHQVLLAIKGFPGRDFVSVGEIAERLQLKPHSAVGLVDRLVKRGLVRRSASRRDGRKIEVRVSSKGERLIGKLSAAHLDELRQRSPLLRRLLSSIGA
jgi:DNA-binding MarR family transcriptional regulator